MSRYVLAIDAGTTGVTVLCFEKNGLPSRHFYSEFPQYFPRPGWVEHDVEEIWQTVQKLLAEALEACGGAAEVAAIGITNQRETTVVWERDTSRPIHRAIVWQCRRTMERCQQLKAAGHEERFKQATGLVLDAYFSGTKLGWILDQVDGSRARAQTGEVLFGTIDSYLLWRLTGGGSHLTDHTNASRTLLYNLEDRTWDPDLCEILGVPLEMLPGVQASSSHFGDTSAEITGQAIPITGMCGDQQSALFGHGAVEAGGAKNTYGTGCFLLFHTGDELKPSASGLLTTMACDAAGAPAYCQEGSVFVAGALMQWLRDGLGVISDAAESEQLARSVGDSGGVYIVPAFVGLGAPYWDMEARGAILGLTQGSGRAHVVRAALEAVAYQTRDLLEAIRADTGASLSNLRVDGGMCRNDFLMQFQADLLQVPVERPVNVEVTASGAAYLAGLQVGFWQNWGEISAQLPAARVFEPSNDVETDHLYAGWKDAVARVRSGN